MVAYAGGGGRVGAEESRCIAGQQGEVAEAAEIVRQWRNGCATLCRRLLARRDPTCAHPRVSAHKYPDKHIERWMHTGAQTQTPRDTCLWAQGHKQTRTHTYMHACIHRHRHAQHLPRPEGDGIGVAAESAVQARQREWFLHPTPPAMASERERTRVSNRKEKKRDGERESVCMCIDVCIDRGKGETEKERVYVCV
jgi:hypothetical protein